MKIPHNCKAWEAQMEAGVQERRIIENIRREVCISPDLERRFFERIAEHDPPESPEKAHKLTVGIVKDNPGFLFQGNPVSDGRFLQLFRIERKDKIWYLCSRDYLKERGIRFQGVLDEISFDLLSDLVEEYKDSIYLGNLLGVVWVTDYEAVREWEDRSGELLDRLGMTGGDDFYVIILYGRDSLEIFVPRIFDAIDQEYFVVNNDCDSSEGRTKPISPGKDGLPEAVHRSCETKPMSMKVSRLS